MCSRKSYEGLAFVNEARFGESPPIIRIIRLARYLNGIVLPIPKKNLDAYRRMAEDAGRVWRECGALEFVECVADDVKAGKLTWFRQSVRLEENESVVFSWIVYQSREQRDRVNERVMKAPRIANMDPRIMPIDGKRMF